MPQRWWKLVSDGGDSNAVPACRFSASSEIEVVMQKFQTIHPPLRHIYYPKSSHLPYFPSISWLPRWLQHRHPSHQAWLADWICPTITNFAIKVMASRRTSVRASTATRWSQQLVHVECLASICSLQHSLHIKNLEDDIPCIL